MLIRCFWPKCDYRDETQSVHGTDALWVEATAEEAAREVFPLLAPDLIARSESLALRSRVARDLGTPPRPFCYLVARDLSVVIPLEPHYPVSPMWNAYCPFRKFPITEILTLAEARDLRMPRGSKESQ